MILTLGTSTRTSIEFFEELAPRRIETLVDVRSRPQSRVSHFDGAALAAECGRRGIRYEWRGRVLGGLNAIPTDDPDFVAAIDEVVGLGRGAPTVLVCAEGGPEGCHRASKVAAAIWLRHGVEARNILRDGTDEPLSATLLRTRPTDIPAEIREAALLLAAKAAASSSAMRAARA